MWSQNFEKKSFLEAHFFHWFYTGVWFSIVFCVSSLSIAQKTLNKLGQKYFANVDSEFKKMNANVGHKFSLKKSFFDK